MYSILVPRNINIVAHVRYLTSLLSYHENAGLWRHNQTSLNMQHVQKPVTWDLVQTNMLTFWQNRWDTLRNWHQKRTTGEIFEGKSIASSWEKRIFRRSWRVTLSSVSHCTVCWYCHLNHQPHAKKIPLFRYKFFCATLKANVEPYKHWMCAYQVKLAMV